MIDRLSRWQGGGESGGGRWWVDVVDGGRRSRDEVGGFNGDFLLLQFGLYRVVLTIKKCFHRVSSGFLLPRRCIRLFRFTYIFNKI